MGAVKKYQPCEPTPTTHDNTVMKAEIDHLKKVLSEKIKDPKLAKKAAMLIAEMLNKGERK